MTETETPVVTEPKAYDPKVLLERLKGRGIEIAEDSARALVEEVFGWTKESAAISENKIDDMVVGLIAPLEVYVYSKIDEIDGVTGN